jgi:DNA helicase-2/ATP-dependent DNA helicase PcrA
VTNVALTPEQGEAARHGTEVYIKACPGAGKTRLIVERLSHLTPSLASRRGVAVLSFTNSAVEEFTVRCRKAHLDHFLTHPHFVGTFDSFVRHFFVIPQGLPGCATRPVVVDSWSTMDVAIRLSGTNAYRGPGSVSLDDFDALTHTIDVSRIGIPALAVHVQQHRAAYEQAARVRRRALRGAGYLSAADCRVEAQQKIQNAPMSAAMGAAMAGRFHEVIVDEAQDCNPLDVELLVWLRNHGVRVTVVCDPDQAIYAFRNGDPSVLAALGATYADAHHRPLTGNFRSSRPICALGATLRSNAVPDRPLGETAAITHPVVILSYAGRVSDRIGNAFIDQMTQVQLRSAQGIVLAHGRKVSQASVGNNTDQSPQGTTKIGALSHAIGTFWAPASNGRARESAVRSVEKLLLQLMGHLQAGEHPTRAMHRVGLDHRKLRRQALELIMAVPRHCAALAADKSAWVTCVQNEIFRLGLPVATGETVTSFFRRPPPNTDWTQYLQPSRIAKLSASTIHDAKGRAYDAVCVVIPPDRAPHHRTSSLLDAWEGRLESEAKRVIYVGATRARMLLALATPQAVTDRVTAILAASNVPNVRWDIVA